MFVKHIGMAHVKTTRLLDLDRAQITARGIAGDRDFILLNEAGQPLGAGHHRHFLPLIFHYDGIRRRLRMTYPNGRVVEDDCFASRLPFALSYMDMRRILVSDVVGEWNRRLCDFSGEKVRMVRVMKSGDGVDVLPITLLTTGSIRDLGLRMGSAIDYRRFRANLVIECDEPYAEDRWEGKTIRIGAAVLRVRSSVPRCVVTQLDPETGKNNARTVAALLEYRQKVHLPDGLMPAYATPGFASYAEVALPGEVLVGDSVVVEQQ
ncbi:MOSC domain-containing protein [Rhizobium sp. YTU87027]|uniref:MOSC domain-containing protein n=1 Tax=Rhizobium sp. YTU87027 TaxID=3417741 RepID=UPI003D69F73A